MKLTDNLLVYPAHGAGSACGKNMSSQTWDTLGNQKATNYALRADMTKEEFVKEVTTGILPPPQYFQKNAIINKSGYESLDVVMKRGNIPLDAETFEAMANHQGALVLDTRSKEDFTKSHIPNSIFIGIDGGFAPWVGALITDIEQAIIFVADAGKEEEVVMRLSRVGYDNTLGYLDGGLEGWVAAGKETESVQGVTAEQMETRLSAEKIEVIDSRKPGEYEAERMDGAISMPLDYINQSPSDLDKESPIFVHCRSGYRSLVFISIMKSRGYHNLIDVQGGFSAMKETGLPICDNSCTSEN
jgi:rhodanese-related sulfurtransferase